MRVAVDLISVAPSLTIAGDPTVRISELARLVGVGEQAAEEIVEDLVAEGYVVRRRVALASLIVAVLK